MSTSPWTRPPRNHTNDAVIMVLVTIASYLFAGQFVGLPFFVMWLMCAAGSAAIAHNKWLSPVHGFVVGILLGPIGLLIAIFQRSGVPSSSAPPVPQDVMAPVQPPQLVSAKCTDCQTINQVPADARRFECGRCGTIVERAPKGRVT